MKRIAAWLRGDLARVRIVERDIAVKRVHLTTLLLVALAALIVGLVLGFAGGFTYPYKTVKPPPVPKGQTVPSCPNIGKATKHDDHSLGQCLPQPKGAVGTTGQTQRVDLLRVVSITRSSTGPDFSNNDPVSCSAWAAIAARNSFTILKVNEGTGFVDSTARPMAACAKAHGLTVGGYDFLHICLTNPIGEAHLFVVSATADGVLGKGTLPGTGDVEYPSSPQCNVRAWLSSWVTAVHLLSGRWPMLYTGGWWWNPHVGAWWYGNLLAWVSGYTGSLSSVPRPAGRSHIDLWQESDRAPNGASLADLSVWLDGPTAFGQATGASSPQPPSSPGHGRYAIFPATAFRFGADHASERNTVRTWDRSHCRNPVRRPVCKSTRAHLRLLRDREWFISHHRPTRNGWVTVKHPRWGANHLGARFQALSKRIG